MKDAEDGKPLSTAPLTESTAVSAVARLPAAAVSCRVLKARANDFCFNDSSSCSANVTAIATDWLGLNSRLLATVKKKPKKGKKNTRMEPDVVVESLIQKLTTYALKPSDNIEGLRGVVTKLYARVSSLDKVIQKRTLERLWDKKLAAIPTILNLLETVRDQMTCNALAGILHECVTIKAGRQTTQALNQLLQENASSILIKVLNQPQIRENPVAYDFFIKDLVWVLSQLAPRDSKFSLKTRLLGALKTFHLYLKIFYNHSKILYPLLLIIKALARNTNTATLLAKDNIVVTLEKVFSNIGYSSTPKLRLALNVLTHLKLCCSRLAQSTCLDHILKVMERWDRYEGKMKSKLPYYSLITLQRACYLKTGRKIIKANLAHIYKFCQNCPDERCFDSSLNRASSIISLCLDRRSLPIDNATFPLKFPLPAMVNNFDNTCESHDGSPEYDDIDSDDEAVEEEDESISQRQNSKVDAVVVVKEKPKTFDEIEMYSKFVSHIFPRKTWKDQCRSGSNKLFEAPVDRGDGHHHHIAALLEDGKNNLFCDKISILKLLENLPNDQQSAYVKIASQVNSTIPFVKVAYPDLVRAESRGILEPFNCKDRDTFRRRLRDSVEKWCQRSNAFYEIVYDLDALCQTTYLCEGNIRNEDLRRLGERIAHDHLEFESRFESGNLRKAIQVGHYEYELILNSDVNSDKHHSWFYFEVSNMLSGPEYVFNIVNCEKVNSQFNYGMKPLLFSVRESQMGRGGWVRTGSNICYFRNSYRKPSNQHKCYFTTAFTIEFPYDYDVCYIAYHFPYTYSQILLQISRWSDLAAQSGIVFKMDSITESLNKNQVPVVSFTAQTNSNPPFSEREIIFLTGRVHPGESNASWILHGLIDFLLGKSPQAMTLREKFIFVTVPMLNVEGVINGCSRCGLTNEDLNRRWKAPSPVLHPEIYHTKGLLEFLCRSLNKPPFVFCDFHGHSRKKNIFVYGCASSDNSWSEVSTSPAEYLLFAHLMARICPSFCYSSCKFRVERSKEATARVSVWRDFGIKRSYTLESSYCGCDQGAFAGQHFDTMHLRDAGRQFCEALACLLDENTWGLEILEPPDKLQSRSESPCSYSSDSDHDDDDTEIND